MPRTARFRRFLLICFAALIIGAVVMVRLKAGETQPQQVQIQPPTPTLKPISSSHPCAVRDQPPARYRHVIWIWLENKTYGQVIGSSAAPYITSLAAQCATATEFHDAGTQYKSLSNYIAATSGVDSCASGGCPSTAWNDCSPAPSCEAPIDNLFRQVRALRKTAASYEESMTSNCQLTAEGDYAPKHNPATYYTGGSDRASCIADDVPLGTTTAGNFRKALSSEATLPAFSFITPNLCNDTHNCSIATGDAWLAGWLPTILDSPAYKSGNMAVMLVYDEDTPIPNVFIAPSIPAGTTSADPALSHYSLLRTTEEMLGIQTLLGKAATAPSLRSIFHF